METIEVGDLVDYTPVQLAGEHEPFEGGKVKQVYKAGQFLNQDMLAIEGYGSLIPACEATKWPKLGEGMKWTQVKMPADELEKWKRLSGEMFNRHYKESYLIRSGPFTIREPWVEHIREGVEEQHYWEIFKDGANHGERIGSCDTEEIAKERVKTLIRNEIKALQDLLES